MIRKHNSLLLVVASFVTCLLLPVGGNAGLKYGNFSCFVTDDVSKEQVNVWLQEISEGKHPCQPSQKVKNMINQQWQQDVLPVVSEYPHPIWDAEQELLDVDDVILFDLDSDKSVGKTFPIEASIKPLASNITMKLALVSVGSVVPTLSKPDYVDDFGILNSFENVHLFVDGIDFYSQVDQFSISLAGTFDDSLETAKPSSLLLVNSHIQGEGAGIFAGGYNKAHLTLIDSVIDNPISINIAGGNSSLTVRGYQYSSSIQQISLKNTETVSVEIMNTEGVDIKYPNIETVPFKNFYAELVEQKDGFWRLDVHHLPDSWTSLDVGFHQGGYSWWGGMTMKPNPPFAVKTIALKKSGYGEKTGSILLPKEIIIDKTGKFAEMDFCGGSDNLKIKSSLPNYPVKTKPYQTHFEDFKVKGKNKFVPTTPLYLPSRFKKFGQ